MSWRKHTQRHTHTHKSTHLTLFFQNYSRKTHALEKSFKCNYAKLIPDEIIIIISGVCIVFFLLSLIIFKADLHSYIFFSSSRAAVMKFSACRASRLPKKKWNEDVYVCNVIFVDAARLMAIQLCSLQNQQQTARIS